MFKPVRVGFLCILEQLNNCWGLENKQLKKYFKHRATKCLLYALLGCRTFMVQYSQEQIRGLKGNESHVQKHVFETLYAPMFRVCHRYIIAQDEAEDCLMKGFMKAFQQIENFKFENEGSLFWWVRRIMINECLMSLRKNRNFKMILEEDTKEVYVDANVLEQMNAEDLNNLILRLPTGYRTVFSLFVIDGFSHAEIAEMIGITESTSRTQLAKSKYKLRQMLEQNDRAYGN